MPRPLKSKKTGRLAVGEAVRFHRQRTGLTQRQLAGLIHARPDSISRIERGHHQPSLERLAAIGHALGVPPESLLARGADSMPGEMLSMLTELQHLDPVAQAFVLETLRRHLDFFRRTERPR
jgi:transcriptional regulator with XRE-family HTH domain